MATRVIIKCVMRRPLTGTNPRIKGMNIIIIADRNDRGSEGR